MTNKQITYSLLGAAGLAASIVVTSCSIDGAEPTDQPTTSTPALAVYRDGSYTADGWYGGQPSRIGVRLDLTGGRITAASVATYATDPTSLDYQRRFAAALPAAVTGKRIDEVRIDRLAGASGCVEGFENALRSIRDQARNNAMTAPRTVP